MSEFHFHSQRCFCPFRKPGEKGHIGKNLRNPAAEIQIKYPGLSETAKICHSCRKKVYAVLNAGKVSDSQEASHADKIVNSNIRKTPKSDSTKSKQEEAEEFLQGIKDHFHNLQDNAQRIQILTMAPLSWSVNKVATEFNCSWRLANNARRLREECGILASPVAKAGKYLSQDTLKEIEDFYQSDENSRQMPGVKDTVSIIVDGEKQKIQKRLLLYNLNALYTHFMCGKTDDIVSFSKFAKLRPRNCILAGASGTHSVCVCTIHQNCKLMLDAINISKLTRYLEYPLHDYKDCLNLLMCKNPSLACHFNECSECPSEQVLFDIVEKLLSKILITDVLFSTWQTTDRATLNTQKIPVEEFLTQLTSKLKQLKPHNFIAKEQAKFMNMKKDNLVEGEVLIQLDFAENYAFVVQDAAQAFHFNNDQCTVHTIIYYYRTEKELKHGCMVVLSDCLAHDTVAVYIIQKMLLQKIQQRCTIKTVLYFTDGAKQHFKNRFQMANLVCHEEDFGIPAEWHFHATAHGKEGCDGVGATFKREATRASLQAQASNAILTPKSLFEWAQNRFENIDVLFYSKETHKKMIAHLNKRFKAALAIPNIQKCHSFIPLDGKKLMIKRFSSVTDNIIFSNK